MNILRSLVIFFAVVPVAFSSSLDATDQQNISQHFNAYVDEERYRIFLSWLIKMGRKSSDISMEMQTLKAKQR